MLNFVDQLPTLAHRAQSIIPAQPDKRLDQNWRPEPCRLTRYEIRKIIADLLD